MARQYNDQTIQRIDNTMARQYKGQTIQWPDNTMAKDNGQKEKH